MAPGGFPFGNMNPSRVVNQTLGWPTNPTINFAYIIRPFKTGFDRALNKGQYVFMKKDQKVVGQKMYTALNLPQLNFFLEHYAVKVMPKMGLKVPHSVMGVMGERDATDEDPIWSKTMGDAIHDQWAPMGVIQGEIGGEDYDRPQERLINVTVSGRIRTFNIFGDKCPDGTRVYMLLKRCTYKQHTPNPAWELSLDGGSLPSKARLKDDNVYFKFVPHAKVGEPPKVNTALGERAYYIGRVSHNPKTVYVPKNMAKNALYDLKRMVTLPMVELFCDYDYTE
jgi:hypothetical protein